MKDLYSKGQIVFSKSGRDKDTAYIVFDCDESYVYVVDGKKRGLEKPKRKNKVHIQPTNNINEDIKRKLENNLYILNSDIRKALAEYNKK